MKVYKYDNITSVSVKKDTKNKLMNLKHRYKFKNIDEVIAIMILNYEEYNS